MLKSIAGFGAIGLLLAGMVGVPMYCNSQVDKRVAAETHAKVLEDIAIENFQYGEALRANLQSAEQANQSLKQSKTQSDEELQAYRDRIAEIPIEGANLQCMVDCMVPGELF